MGRLNNEGAVMSIGDVNSTERGSGARYNDGKPDYSLIPLPVLSEVIYKAGGVSLSAVLAHVGGFQLRYKTATDVRHLVNAISALEQLDPDVWNNCARVFDFGRAKYADWNWRKGFKWSVPLACIGRHAMSVYKGELLDTDSGLPHTGHILCNIVMLMDFIDSYPEGDDRPQQAKEKV